MARRKERETSGVVFAQDAQDIWLSEPAEQTLASAHGDKASCKQCGKAYSLDEIKRHRDEVPVSQYHAMSTHTRGRSKITFAADVLDCSISGIPWTEALG